MTMRFGDEAEKHTEEAKAKAGSWLSCPHMLEDGTAIAIQFENWGGVSACGKCLLLIAATLRRSLVDLQEGGHFAKLFPDVDLTKLNTDRRADRRPLVRGGRRTR